MNEQMIENDYKARIRELAEFYGSAYDIPSDVLNQAQEDHRQDWERFYGKFKERVARETAEVQEELDERSEEEKEMATEFIEGDLSDQVSSAA